jgi:hypothetical protein
MSAASEYNNNFKKELAILRSRGIATRNAIGSHFFGDNAITSNNKAIELGKAFDRLNLSNGQIKKALDVVYGLNSATYKESNNVVSIVGEKIKVINATGLEIKEIQWKGEIMNRVLYLLNGDSKSIGFKKSDYDESDSKLFQEMFRPTYKIAS